MDRDCKRVGGWRVTIPNVDLVEARSVLGVQAGASWVEIRATYRELIRSHHPDTASDLADAGVRTIRTAQITEAFALVVASRAVTPESGPYATSEAYLGASFRHPTVAADDTRVVLLDTSAGEAFLALHEAFSVLGAVSYVDRLSLVLEAIVVPRPSQATSLLCWLDSRPDGMTNATICVESLGGHPAADLDGLVDRIAQLLAAPRPPVVPA